MMTFLGGIVISIFSILAFSVLLWWLRSHKRLRLFEEGGIPGPKPEFFWGNMRQMRINRNEVLMDWKTKYGKMFGVFRGHEPFLVITDPDMVNECFIKQAHIFRDRPKALVDAEPFRSSLFQISGEEWKFVRGVVKHAFTSKKIREHSDWAKICTTRFVESLNNACALHGYVDVTKFAMSFSVDFLTNALFTWDINCQEHPNNEVLKSLMELSEELDAAAIEAAFAFTTPLLRYVVSLLYPLTDHAKKFNKLTQPVRNIVQTRRSSTGRGKEDVLQVILDTQSEGCSQSPKDGVKQENLFHDQYILSNFAIFLFAGFDGMSASLSFLLYLIAKHPSEQEAIIREVYERFPDRAGQLLDFDELRQLKRLDIITKEGLRIYPPVPVEILRQCVKDTTVCGQFIPAGMNVLACPWLIHRDSDVWPDPETFLPERFAGSSSNHKKGCFLPLGIGPRKCIGEELGLLAVKSALLGLLQSCTISLKEEKAGPLRAVARALTLVPEGGVKIEIRPKSAKVDNCHKQRKQ